jgi:mannose-6-phosphate isomerase
MSAVAPIVFEPLFMERVWGGRRLEALSGKKLPPGPPIGESWEVVDRPEAQSVVRGGTWAGRALHDLWTGQREAVLARWRRRPRDFLCCARS